MTLNSAGLADVCRVSRRTLFRDIRLLRDCGLQVRYDEQLRAYSLPAKLFSVMPQLTEEETLSMFVLCNSMGDARAGIPYQRSARSAAFKLANDLPCRSRETLDKAAKAIVIQLGPHATLQSKRLEFDTILQAARERRCVRTFYGGVPGQKELNTLLSPYCLVFRWQNWHVIGRSSLHREVRTFDLNRISQLELLDRRFKIPPRFSVDRHFGNAWRVIRDRKNHHYVVVRFQQTIAGEVAAVRWHRTQNVVWNSDGTIDFHVTVEGLKEISHWILGYGSQAEVLQPGELREVIADQLRRMCKLYTSAKPKESNRKSKRIRDSSGITLELCGS